MAERAATEVAEPRPVHDGRVPLTAGGLAFVLALAVLLATGHTEVERSADEYGATPLWAVLLPVAVGLALVRLVPPRVPTRVTRRVHAALRGRPLGLESSVLLGCVLAFVVVNLLLPTPADPEDPAGLLYPLSKVVLFLAAPLVVLRFLRPAWRAEAPRLVQTATRPGEAWRWGGLVAVVVVLYLTVFSPIAPPVPSAADLPPLPVLLVVMTTTFLTASVLEEVFFRYWLQTRLEILYGRWAGILLASLVFAVMHVVSHQATGNPGTDLATVVVVQGSMGLLLGYLWARYRNVWLLIVLHGGTNALGLVPALAGM